MKIKNTKNTPYVKLDSDICTLTIKGASYPEHAGVFYDPIFKRINECLPEFKKSKVTVNLALIIMNSVSEKCIFKILKEICKNTELHVNWYYESDDEDMENEGHTWSSSLSDVKFNMYSVDDIDKIYL